MRWECWGEEELRLQIENYWASLEIMGSHTLEWVRKSAKLTKHSLLLFIQRTKKLFRVRRSLVKYGVQCFFKTKELWHKIFRSFYITRGNILCPGTQSSFQPLLALGNPNFHLILEINYGSNAAVLKGKCHAAAAWQMCLEGRWARAVFDR
jgi:hypothetical protein